MELDWSTFLLEIINFLILVWILKRFLYGPVLHSLAARREKVEGVLLDAEKARSDAISMKAAEEERLREWERKKQGMESGLAEEMVMKRERMREELAAEIEKEKSRRAAVESRKLQEWSRDIEEQAIETGSIFASKLLSRLASPGLEDSLFDLFMAEIVMIDSGKIRASLRASDSNLEVWSAYPLSPEKRELLAGAIEEIAGRPLHASFRENGDLVCGMRIAIGAWIIHASLADELAFFRRAPDDGV